MESVPGEKAIVSLVILGEKPVVQVRDFVSSMKVPPADLRCLSTGLEATVGAFIKAQIGLEAPYDTTVAKLLKRRDKLDMVIEDLVDVFRRLSAFVEKYDEFDRSYWQKANWWTIGMEEAVRLVLILSLYEAILITKVATLPLD